MNRTAKGIVAIIASAFGFALMGFFVRLCDNYGQAVSPFQKSFFRNIVAFALAAAVLFRKWTAHRVTGESINFADSLDKAALGKLLLRCIFGTAGIFANFYALSHIPVGEAMCLNKTAPFWTVLFSYLFLCEKMTFPRAVMLGVAFIGAALVARPGYRELGSFAAAMGLVGGICAGAAYACVRSLGKSGVDSAFIVFSFSAFSTVASLPFMCGEAYTPMSAAQLAILILAGASAAIGQFGVTLAYSYAPSSKIAVYDYTNVIFASALGWMFLGQTPDLLAAAGFAMILAAAIVPNAAKW